MRQKYLTLLFAFMGLTGCSTKAQDIRIVYSGNTAKVTPMGCDSIAVKVDGAMVEIESAYQSREVEISMEGKSENGCLVLKSAGRATIFLRGLELSCSSGAPIWLKNKKRVEIVASSGTANSLCVASCRDTASCKAAAIWAKGKIKFDGKGRLDVLAKGDGCKGISAKGDIKIDNLTLSVITEGNNLGKDTSGHGGFGGFPFGDMPEGFPDFSHFPGFPGGMPEGFPDFSHFPGFPGGMPEGAPDFSQFPGFPGGIGFGAGESGDPDETIRTDFKQKYIATTKAIKSGGVITINGGSVYCKTSSAGAEGIEGKKGVAIAGGQVRVDAVDDAINSNGPITVSGGQVIAESHANDAIDSNLGGLFSMMGQFPPMPGQAAANGNAEGNQKTKESQEPAISITGGEVYAWSHLGMPEEGMDCDFAPFLISGGTIFSLGAGMGELPSVPSQETSLQPSVIFTGLGVEKGEVLEICKGGKPIFSMTMPFSFRNSASLFTCPGLEKGASYTLRTSEGVREFSLSDNFSIVRKE